MKMIKKGFTLIELIIGMAISSGISIVIFTSFYQTQKSSKALYSMISLDSRVSILQNQFEKDISGVFAPNTNEVKEPEKPMGQKKEQEEKKEAPVSGSKLEKIFYATNQNKNLKELTFITSNPLQVYGQSKPRIARVPYLLKEDKQRKGSYTLFRRESNKLEYAHKSAVEYEIIDGIKEFKIDYLAPIKKDENLPDKEKKEQINTQTPKKEKKAPELKTYNEWKFEDKKQVAQKEKQDTFLIPQFVNVKVVLWQDYEQTREESFEFKYFIYAFESQFPKKPTKTTEDKMQGLVNTMEQLKKGLPENPKK